MNKISDEVINELYQEHLNGVMITELAKKYNLNYGTMVYRFKSRNLPIIKDLHKCIKYKKPFNENYFSDINTEIKAYYLGLIFSDGYIMHTDSHKKSLGIKLQTQDGYIIERLQSELEAYHYKLIINNNHKSGLVGLVVNSEKIFDDLVNLGVKCNKSRKELDLPNINDSLFPHFLRGLIDGDGWISICKKRVNIGLACSSKLFLKQIEDKINSLYNIKSTIYTKHNDKINPKWHDLHTLYISNNESRSKLLALLYENATIYLNRKLLKSIQANTVLNSKIKKLESV